ncbi:MAG: basic amino acid ABC transporter substrate-binding protein [Limnochordales bacterium]|nr:basic amino acid ABC transporter substrate-binding protein [Limnochordales bacterium]
MKKVGILLVLLALVLAGSVPALAAGKLRVATDATFPPFEFVDEKGREVVGFDIDIIKEIGRRLGMTVEIINTAWDGLLPGLKTGKFDVVIAGMTITDERAQAVDFSDPYFATGQVILVRPDTTDIKEPADLKGKVVAVQIGTTGHFAAQKIQGLKRIDTYDTYPAAFLALKMRKADAVIADELVAKEEQRANPGQVRVVGRPFTVEYYGIAVNKGRTDLLRQINRALALMKADGTYDAIYEKWFGAE